MANQEHLDILKQGVEVWNQWREEHPEIRPDLSEADLEGVDLEGVDLEEANLSKTNLSWANLCGANLCEANLSEANLSEADLSKADLILADLILADLSHADLSDAELTRAKLVLTDLTDANLTRADLRNANLFLPNLTDANFTEVLVESTSFGNVDLSTVKGLETVLHKGPSTIGIDTIYASHGDIPEAFLKGAGVDDTFITYVRSLVNKSFEYYSCFISYSSKDDAFVRRLYADLQSNNVRCWFAPHDLKTGDRYRDRIEESIRVYDKVLLILSENAVASTWVEEEVEKAMDKERQLRAQGHKRTVLFPIKLDDTVMQTTKAWAADVRRMWHIGDFINWHDYARYQRAFTRLLRDLKSEA